MFDKETSQFFHLLRTNTIGDASSIGLRSILESNIPANVKTFFRADVEWLRAREKAKEVRSAKFSYALSEVRLLDEQIDLLLINNYTFSRKDFDATADKCIHFLLNYLCRPEWTLSSFFFDVSIRITAEEMRSKLRYCADYPYFRTILPKYTESRQRTDVGSEEMKRLLTTIDDEICATATASELAAIAKPIFDFVGVIRASMQPPMPVRVPLRALIYFFEDKRLAAIAAALSALRELDNNFQLTFPMLEMVLEAVLSGSPVPELSALAAASAPDPLPPTPIVPTAAEDANIEPLIEEQRSPDNMRDGFDGDSVAPVESTGQAEPAEFEQQQEPISESHTGGNGAHAGTSPGSDWYASSSSSSSSGSMTASSPGQSMGDAGGQPDLLESAVEATTELNDNEGPAAGVRAQTDEDGDEPTLVFPPQFTENDRITITNVLFQGSAELFESAVETAVKAENWDEAAGSLDRFFAEWYIDPFKKEAMMFSNILESWHRTLKK